MSEETKIKIGKSNKGKVRSEQTRKRLSESHKGKIMSEENKAKLIKANKGRVVSDETKKKMSKCQAGKNNPMYGKHHSEETKKRISEKNKGKQNGKIISDEAKRKMSLSHKGKKLSEEHKINIGKNSTIKRKVICLNNLKIYDSGADAARCLNIDYRHISCVCKGNRKTTKGYKFMYLEEYLIKNNTQLEKNNDKRL
jgi:hypothetical protein